MPPTISQRIEGVTARDSFAVYRAAAPPATLALAALAALPFAMPAAQVFLGCFAVAMIAVAAHAWRARRDHTHDGALDVSDECAIFTSGGLRTELPWSAITRWSLDDARDVVTLERDDASTWTLGLPDDDAVAAVLTPLRRVHARRVVTIPLRGRFDGGGWTVPIALLALGAPLPLADAVARLGSAALGVFVWLLGVTLATCIAREVCRARVTVGDDGFSLQHLGSERFVPWAHVSALDWDELGVQVTLIDGEEVALPVLSHAMVRHVGDASVERAIKQRDALHERLRVGLDGWAHRRANGDALESLLDRRGRPLDDWRAAVRRLADAADGYRGVSFDPELATRVLDDPSAPIERRVAAVWALRDHDGPQALPRVRVALDAVACEPVREALARAADDYLDEDTLDRAEEFAGR